jgi:major membrane immunogen (membrane-anchored lipoprotein)
MRKILSIAIALLVVVGGLALAEGMWQDGVYTAEADQFSDNGWKNMVRLVVENGYIVEAHFDAIPEEGDKMKYLQSVQGEYGMVANSGATDRWYVQVDRAATMLMEMQDPSRILNSSGGVDAISGVTVTIAPHFQLAHEALDGAGR